MSYDSLEQSLEGSAPIEIYFFYMDVQYWRFTSSDADQVVDGSTYKAYPIERSRITQGQEMARNSLTVKMSSDDPFLDMFRPTSPTNMVGLDIIAYHDGFPADRVTAWTGRVLNVSFSDDGNTAELTCEPLYTTMRRNLLKMSHQLSCPHTLYDPKTCRVNKELHVVTATISSIVGLVINSSDYAGFDDNWFAGGWAEWNTGSLIERRFITKSTSGSITLDLPFLGISGSAVLKTYPGCEHTLNICNIKFANEDNHGGVPFAPSKNPLNGTSIY